MIHTSKRHSLCRVRYFATFSPFPLFTRRLDASVRRSVVIASDSCQNNGGLTKVQRRGTLFCGKALDVRREANGRTKKPASLKHDDTQSTLIIDQASPATGAIAPFPAPPLAKPVLCLLTVEIQQHLLTPARPGSEVFSWHARSPMFLQVQTIHHPPSPFNVSTNQFIHPSWLAPTTQTATSATIDL